MNNTNKNQTDVVAWSVRDLVYALGENDPKKNKINIPKFQRNLVWSEEKRMMFAESVKRGYPIGSLLLHKTGSEDGFTRYQLIDGLQRSSTLKKYKEKPTEYFIGSEIDDSLVLSIKKYKNILHKDEIKKTIVKWVKNLEGFDENSNFSSFNLTNFIDTELDLDLSKDEVKALTSNIIPFIYKVKNDADIFDFKIPIIIYSGDPSNLPEIFSRLNKQGTQLNKYQIYAAAWSVNPDNFFNIINGKIIEKIEKKYEKIIEEGFEIEGYDSTNFKTEKFSAFEYFFGFGKLLIENYKHLFNDRKGDEESIGFNLVGTCLGLGVKSLDNLPEYYLKVNQTQFENAIFDCINILDNILKPYISLNANKKNGNKKPTIYHTEYQILSLIGKIYHSKYDVEAMKNWKKTEIKLRENIPLWYLFDILKGTWRNTPDTILRVTTNDRYEKPIPKFQWDYLFQEWIEEDLKKQEKNRVNISDSTILFYKYLYTDTITYKENSAQEFEIEHLVSVERLKKINKDGKGIPMSAFPNLCLLQKELNSSKKGKGVFEFLSENKSSTNNYKDIERFALTTKEEMDILGDRPNLKKYIEFLKNRFKNIKTVFYEKNNIKNEQENEQENETDLKYETKQFRLFLA